MKKIIFLGAGLGSGGAEHQCSQLMNMLVEKGYEVTYASIEKCPDHYYVDPRVKRVYLGVGRATLMKIVSVFLYMLRVRADVVIAFSQRMSVLALPPLLLRPGLKVISSERNFTIGEPDIFEKILTRTGLYRRATYIVPNSFSQGNYLAEKMLCIANKVRVITNYTNIDEYKVTPLPDNKLMRIGIFCRFERQKNFHRFIDVLRRLKEHGFDTFHVDWYGNHTFTSESQTNYFNEGVEKMKNYGVEDLITIHEATKDVSKLLPDFDVLCLPSLHEGFSNSISEYICSGRPVICSNVSDNNVMVCEGENGYLFNPFDERDMLRTFVTMLKTSFDVRKEMGIKSRVIAEKLFDKNRFLNSYISLIEK